MSISQAVDEGVRAIRRDTVSVGDVTSASTKDASTSHRPAAQAKRTVAQGKSSVGSSKKSLSTAGPDPGSLDAVTPVDHNAQVIASPLPTRIPRPSRLSAPSRMLGSPSVLRDMAALPPFPSLSSSPHPAPPPRPPHVSSSPSSVPPSALPDVPASSTAGLGAAVPSGAADPSGIILMEDDQAPSESQNDHLYALPPPPDAFILPDHLPSLEEITRTKVNTMVFIPIGARNDVTRLFTEILYDVVRHPDAIPRWSLLLLMAKCILAAPPRGGRRHYKDQEKMVKERVRRWKAGEIFLLWGEAKAPPAPTRGRRAQKIVLPSQEEVNSRRCLRLVQAGQYSRAIQALLSRGLDQDSPAAAAAMADKHPFAPPPVISSEDLPPPPRFEAKDVRKAVFSFNPGSAPGPSGLRPEHLKKMISSPDPAHGRKFLNALTSFVNLMVAGSIPDEVAPFICGANLFAALKKDGGHRPVAVGDIYRRLTSKCAAFKFTPAAADILKPCHQLGVGVRGGVECAVHAVRAVLEDDDVPGDQKWVLQLDFKNAFNTISRACIFEEVRSSFPQLAPWVEKAYGCQPNLNFGRAVLLSYTGVHQGDPLASLLFALGARRIQTKISEKVPDLLLQTWIHDDGTLIGSLDSLRQAYDVVAVEGLKIGLELSPSKSLVWNALPALDDDPLQRAVPRAPSDGFVLLGTPMGNANFSNETLGRRISKIEEAMRKLPDLNDSHVEFTLLRSCLGLPKFNFCLRTCKPRELAASFESFDGLLRHSLCALLGSQVDEMQWMQASLPVSMGGLGLQNASPHSAGAYLVSLAHALPIIESIFPSAFNRLRHADSLDMLNARVSPSSAFSFDDLKSKPQIQVTHAVDLRIQELTLALASSPRDKARLGCVSLAHSGDWLNGLPSFAFNLHMPGAEFRTAVRYRLGVPIYQEDGKCPACDADSDSFGDHAIACGYQGERNSRHNILRDDIFNTAKAAGLSPTKEERGIIDEDESRPADVKIPMWIRGKDVAYDVTVCSPLSASYVQRSAREASHTLDTSFESKHRKHGDHCRRKNVVFCPLPVQTLGSWHPEAAAELRRIGESLAKRSPGDDKTVVRHFFQRLGIILQRGNAHLLLSRQPSYPAPVLIGN